MWLRILEGTSSRPQKCPPAAAARIANCHLGQGIPSGCWQADKDGDCVLVFSHTIPVNIDLLQTVLKRKLNNSIILYFYLYPQYNLDVTECATMPGTMMMHYKNTKLICNNLHPVCFACLRCCEQDLVRTRQTVHRRLPCITRSDMSQ